MDNELPDLFENSDTDDNNDESLESFLERDDFHRDKINELLSPNSLPQLFTADVCSNNAARQIIKTKVAVYRKGKNHVFIETESRTLGFRVKTSYPSSGTEISFTTTQANDLTYVVIGGSVVTSHFDNNNNRFVFSDPDLAETFKKDMTSAITDDGFEKSDHLFEGIDQFPDSFGAGSITEVSKQKNKCPQFVYVAGYSLLTIGLLFFASGAVMAGWSLANKLFS